MKLEIIFFFLPCIRAWVENKRAPNPYKNESGFIVEETALTKSLILATAQKLELEYVKKIIITCIQNKKKYKVTCSKHIPYIYKNILGGLLCMFHNVIS